MQVSTYFKGHKGLVNSREDNFKTFNLFIPSKSQGRVAMERHFVASARFFGRNVDSKTNICRSALRSQSPIPFDAYAEMINTIETGIGIGLFPIIGIGIGIGFKQTLLIGIGIGIGKFLFWLIGFGIGIGKFQGTTIGFGIGIGKIQCITIGFAIGIGKVDLSVIGIGIDCQLLDFPIPIPIFL